MRQWDWEAEGEREREIAREIEREGDGWMDVLFHVLPKKIEAYFHK